MKLCKPERDGRGRFLSTDGAENNELRIFELSARFREAIKGAKTDFSRDICETIISDCEAAVRGDERPIDDFLRNVFRFTNFDSGTLGLYSLRHRVLVHSEITTKNNLSVKLGLQFVDERGYGRPAKEWNEPARFGMSGGLNRPADELLFIHDIARLMTCEGKEIPSLGNHGSDELVERACLLVSATFWLVVRRIRRQFAVSVMSFPMLVRPEPEGRVIGLFMANSREARQAELKERLVVFEAETGWDPAAFSRIVNDDVERSGDPSRESMQLLRSKWTGKWSHQAVIDRMAFLRESEMLDVWVPSRKKAAVRKDGASQPVPTSMGLRKP